MTAEYDPIVRQYRRSKELPFRLYSEIPDHLEALGRVDGLSVLDVACGEGFYTRLIRHAGAARVVGVDVSAGMIAWAREQEQAAPLGIEYVQIAAEQMADLGQFDIVSTAYLLNTAPDRRSLAAMAHSIAACLAPGGRFVATLGDLCRFPEVDYRPYGMEVQFPSPVTEGAPYTIRFLLDEETFTITDFAWSHEVLEQVLQQAGFRQIEWLLPTVTHEGVTRFGAEFWRTYLENPPLARVVAERGSSPSPTGRGPG